MFLESCLEVKSSHTHSLFLFLTHTHTRTFSDTGQMCSIVIGGEIITHTHTHSCLISHTPTRHTHTHVTHTHTSHTHTLPRDLTHADTRILWHRANTFNHVWRFSSCLEAKSSHAHTRSFSFSHTSPQAHTLAQGIQIQSCSETKLPHTHTHILSFAHTRWHAHNLTQGKHFALCSEAKSSHRHILSCFHTLAHTNTLCSVPCTGLLAGLKLAGLSLAKCEQGGIWESEFGLLPGNFFAGLFAGHFAGLSPASFSAARSLTKGNELWHRANAFHRVQWRSHRTHTLSLSSSHTSPHTYSLSSSHTLSRHHTQAHTHTLSHLYTQAHTHTLSLVFTHKPTRTLSLVSTRKLTRTLSLVITHKPTHTLSFVFTHKPTRTLLTQGKNF